MFQSLQLDIVLAVSVLRMTASMDKKNAIHSFIIQTNITVLFFRDSLIKL